MPKEKNKPAETPAEKPAEETAKAPPKKTIYIGGSKFKGEVPAGKLPKGIKVKK